LLAVSLIALVGMWFERYMIITSSLSEDFLPSSFGFFKPTIWDILTYVGSIGFFFVPFLLFLRYLPLMSISETRALLPGAHGPEVGR
jgi:molybdopterin-containing oxidoreductase family membrane subunit